MSLVVDSSVALTWCFRDERTPATEAVLNEIVLTSAKVPSIWPLEVLNVLLQAERRKRLTAAHRHQFAGFLRDLPVLIDHEGSRQAWSVTARIAEQHRLTLYDAAYLELARRLEWPLATLDRDLRAAAGKSGVALRGLAEDV